MCNGHTGHKAWQMCDTWSCNTEKNIKDSETNNII